MILINLKIDQLYSMKTLVFTCQWLIYDKDDDEEWWEKIIFSRNGARSIDCSHGKYLILISTSKLKQK